MMNALKGRVALVTGSGQGIGAEVARQLAHEGAAVGILDKNTQFAQDVAAEIVAKGGAAIAVPGDVTVRSEVQAAVDRTVAEFGSLHILVNNAGVLRDAPLADMTDDDWTTVVDVHMRGAFLATQIAHTHMIKAGYGRIVTLSSTSALGNGGQVNYAAAKAGLQGFTKTLAVDLGKFGITSNAIAPGFIETGMTKGTAERAGGTIDQMRQIVQSILPVRKAGVPADIANAVLFFVGENAGYVTGQVLYVDGGQSLPRRLADLVQQKIAQH